MSGGSSEKVEGGTNDKGLSSGNQGVLSKINRQNMSNGK